MAAAEPTGIVILSFTGQGKVSKIKAKTAPVMATTINKSCCIPADNIPIARHTTRQDKLPSKDLAQKYRLPHLLPTNVATGSPIARNNIAVTAISTGKKAIVRAEPVT
jgi:hypothetical protein